MRMNVVDASLSRSHPAGRPGWRWASVVYAVLLTYLVLTPNPWWLFGFNTRDAELAVDATLGDAVQHASAYALFAALLVLGWGPRARSPAFGRSPRSPHTPCEEAQSSPHTPCEESQVTGLWLCLCLPLAHGLASEVAQAYIPLRTADWRDAVDRRPVTTTLEETPTAPLPAACRHATLSATIPPRAWVSFSVYSVPVTVSNASECTWPGLAVRSDGLVVLTSEWVGASVEDVPPAIVARLPHDLRPGESVGAEALVLAPRVPGEYRLRVLLVQQGTPGVLAVAEGPVRVLPGRTE